MIEDIGTNKKLSPIVTELFSRGRKLDNSLVFISQSDFKIPKTIRLPHIILSRKYLTKDNFNKQHQIIHLTVSLKIS